MPPTEDFVESTKARNVERVWKCLMNDDDRKIGVYGMGGVGKTTIMDYIQSRLLEEKDKFDGVFWVTVSKAFNIIKLQSNIAKELNFSFSDDEDERRRATHLHAVLSRWKRYVLIIDDLWEAFPLKSAGIPEPTQSNGCKIVLTTRSLSVCKKMDFKDVKVELLTQQEARTLLLRKAVGNGTVLAPEVEEIATKIAEKCGGLPLAVVTVAGTLRGLEGTHVWRDALNDLISSRKDPSHGDIEVFEILKFSYDRLENKGLQDCFLYCSLYPEDHKIPVNELIEYWIVEELISDMNSVKEQFDKGHAILGKLTRSCILESITDIHGMMKHVKLHDLIRDMAIRITASSPRFMVKAGERITSVPYEHWFEDLERISFMDSLISELPITPHVCPKLTTLLLKGTCGSGRKRLDLEVIPDPFFINMPCLEVLDLSWSTISSLPKSISNLEKLHALILRGCRCLKYVPSLKKLKALKTFVLTGSNMDKLPEGIEELVNLRKLDLSDNVVIRRTYPSWNIRGHSKLQYLRLDRTRIKVSAKELLCLSQLKVVGAHFHNVQELTSYVISPQFQGLQDYYLIVRNCFRSERHAFWSERDDLGKWLSISFKSFPFGIGVDHPMLPADIEYFGLNRFHDPISLSAIPGFKDAKAIRSCIVECCNGLESLISSSTFSEDGHISLETIELLKLERLPRFRVLFDGIAPPHSICFNLKKLCFFKCEAVKNIFPVQLLQNFPNLADLQVKKCKNVEDIIVKTAEMSDRGSHQDYRNSINLPKLKLLDLEFLPRLKNIYNGIMVCPSLEAIWVNSCPMVRRLPLPLSLHMDGEQATAPSGHSFYITAEKKWWESLEWDDPVTKTILQPYAVYYLENSDDDDDDYFEEDSDDYYFEEDSDDDYFEEDSGDNYSEEDSGDDLNKIVEDSGDDLNKIVDHLSSLSLDSIHLNK